MTTPTKTSKMNDNAKAWVAALRSGEFKQAKQYLHLKDEVAGDSFCCLGVACKMFDAANPDVLRIGRTRGFVEYDSCGSILPYVVQQWLGLGATTGVFDRGNKSLASQNDSGKSFAEIADIIESEPEGLFA